MPVAGPRKSRDAVCRWEGWSLAFSDIRRHKIQQAAVTADPLIIVYQNQLCQVHPTWLPFQIKTAEGHVR